MVGLMESSSNKTCASMLPRTDAVSVPHPSGGRCRHMHLPETPEHTQASLAQSFVESLLLSPGSCCAQGFVCALQESVSPVLWRFCYQIHWPSKSKFLRILIPFWIPRLGNLLWGLELYNSARTSLV